MTSMLMVEWLPLVINKRICFIHMVIPTVSRMLCYYQDIKAHTSMQVC